MSKPLDALMEKEMSRKEFMAVLGLGLGSILGFSTIIKLLTGKSLDHHISTPSIGGYNSGSYGGGKD